MRIPISWLKEYVPLPKNLKVLTRSLSLAGHMLDKSEVVDNDPVIDLELRGNRADCYGLYGIAREIAAIFKTKAKPLPVLRLTKVAQLPQIKLSVKTPLVKRVGFIPIFNIIICPSPSWLANRLKKYGLEPINNIVDLTNYVMLETGEPLHAFDADLIGPELEIRLAKAGEKITTFQGLTLILKNEDLVWTKRGQVLSVAGAVGEKHHSIQPQTRNILVEAANYDRANIRKTIYRHKLLTDAGIRHEKELDPNLVETALGRFLFLLQKHGWGTFKPVFADYYPKKVNPWKIKLSFTYLQKLGGVEIDPPVVTAILKSLNFKILKKNKQFLEVLVPTYRTDVAVEEDLIEEVLRIFGYDKIPEKTLSLEIPKDITPKFVKQEERLRTAAVACGFDEVITNSFVKESAAHENRHPDNSADTTISLVNPPSPDNQYLRQTLFPNLWENSEKIMAERGEKALLFEIGKVYHRIKNGYQEPRKIGFLYWQKGESDFSKFKGYLEAFFVMAKIKPPDFRNEANNLALAFPFNLTSGGKMIGFGGQKEGVFFTEIDLDRLLPNQPADHVSLWPMYPPQIEDLTFTFPPKTYLGEVISLISNIEPRVSRVELKDTYKDTFTFRIWFQDPKKTLTNEEVTNIRWKLLQSIKMKFGGSAES
jgi:phenylalanyl-tRNA synthetase beta chain